MGHAAGEVHDFPGGRPLDIRGRFSRSKYRCLGKTGGHSGTGGLEVGIVIRQRVVDRGALGAAESRSVHPHRTQRMALVAHQALVSYSIDFLLIMPAQKANEIDR